MAPAINQMYEEEQEKILSSPDFQRRPLVVCGDARMDSPGFSTTKATYSLMKHDSGVVLHMEHGDKRQVHVYGHCTWTSPVEGSSVLHFERAN